MSDLRARMATIVARLRSAVVAWRARRNRFDLVDLSDLDFDAIGAGDNTVLAHSLRRILEDIDRPAEAVAGWNAAIG